MHTIFHKTRQYKKATELADLVASEQLGIYSLFSKDDMTKLLDVIRYSSRYIILLIVIFIPNSFFFTNFQPILQLSHGGKQWRSMGSLVLLIELWLFVQKSHY